MLFAASKGTSVRRRIPSSMRLLLLAAMVGCTSETRVVLEMERALILSNVAIAAELVTTEILVRSRAEPSPPPEKTQPLRHGESCGCPCIERIDAGGITVTTLDYPGTGCVPTSGLVPTTLSGHAVLEDDGATAEVTLGALTLGRVHAIEGSIGGAPLTGGGTSQVVADLQLADHSIQLDCAIVWDPDRTVRLDGIVTIDGEALGLDDMAIPVDDIAPPCPSPTTGVATLRGSPPVTVTFGADATADVRRRNRVSAGVDLCGYRSELL